jgi:drug/metabolite transporter (DMT)-like permease
MTVVTPDTSLARGRVLALGLALAATSAVTFSLAGPLASGLFDAGWSPGAVVLARVTLGALVVLPLGIASLRGRWGAVRRNAGLIVAYGVLGVAGAQFCYFSAVQYMQVGPALLIEYTAPVAVVAWFWARHGQRPGRMTLGGMALAAVGLVLVLDLMSDAQLSPVGVAWALGAMIGAATYFVIIGKTDTGLPPLALASGGLVVGALVLAVLGVTGLMPVTASTVSPVYSVGAVPWWSAVLVIGVVAAGAAYVTGIAAGRRLGSRLSSFVALSEVAAAVVFAWLLLGELPRPVQLLGGVLILAGVVAVQQGERTTAHAARRPS